ncbi:acetyltransferase [Xylaria nigripes]|nr:acetyltransferase [Xylaria nigripes]
MTAHPIPKTVILTTKRLYLRPYETTDAPAMAEACNDLDIAKYMTSRFPSPYTVADSNAWIAHCLSAADSEHHYGIYTLSGEFVGSVDIEPHSGDAVYAGTGRIGYYCGRKFRGRGFMTEAVREFTRWAFAHVPGLMRIHANVFEPNEASKRVLVKAGFIKEGTMRSAVVKHGERMSEEIFGLIRADIKEEEA